MPLPDWMKPEELTPENRAHGIKHRELLAGMADATYRIVEMTIVLGFITYVEQRAEWRPALSILLGALMWAYVQSKLGIGLLSAVDRFHWTEKVKRRVFRSLIFVSFGISAVVYTTMQVFVVPAIVAKENGTPLSSRPSSLVDPTVPHSIKNPDPKPHDTKRRADASKDGSQYTGVKGNSGKE